MIDNRLLSLSRSILGHKRPVICDIGSRDATEGILLFKELRGQHLHVFEPNPAAATLCVANLRNIDPYQVTFNELAVSDEVGPKQFFSVNPNLSDNKDIGFSSLFEVNPDYTRRRGSIVQEPITVRCTTLDAYFNHRLKPDLLWIDVEGAELKVLKGATDTLKHTSLIHLEVSHRPMQIGKPLFEEIRSYLASQEFEFVTFAHLGRFKNFLYKFRLYINAPWRLDAIFVKRSYEP